MVVFCCLQNILLKELKKNIKNGMMYNNYMQIERTSTVYAIEIHIKFSLGG